MRKFGQGIIEYTLFLCLIIGALLIMGYYIRNAISGKWREGADAIGQGEIYHPLNTTVSQRVENR